MCDDNSLLNLLNKQNIRKDLSIQFNSSKRTVSTTSRLLLSQAALHYVCIFLNLPAIGVLTHYEDVITLIYDIIFFLANCV